MIEKTNLADNVQVLSIIIADPEKKEMVKEHMFKELPKMKAQLVDEDHEELIFEIPAKGCGYSLNRIRMELNSTKAEYQLSILCVDNGEFERFDVGG